MRLYELMMIHRPEMAEINVRSQITTVESTIAETGAVEDSDFWGKRRFAYEIDHINEGFYSVVQFEGGPELVAQLDRALSLTDTVVRHKIIRRNPSRSTDDPDVSDKPEVSAAVPDVADVLEAGAVPDVADVLEAAADPDVPE